MDTPPGGSGFGYRSSASRRSFPNLQQISLAPLSSRFPMDADDADSDYIHDQPTPSTYIAGKSSPHTPGILSRDTSPNRRRAKRKSKNQNAVRYSHESFFPSETPDNMSKAKSTSALAAARNIPQTPSAYDNIPQTLHKSNSIAPAEFSDEWIHRAGMAITSESRLTKGQSWIASRASSTALNLMTPDDNYSAKRQQKLALLSSDPSHPIDLDDVPSYYHQYTPRNLSRNASRAASRAPSHPGSKSNSRQQSRRGSRVGNRAELIGLTPMGDLRPDASFIRPTGSVSSAKLSASRARDVPGYFDAVDVSVGAEPDFVYDEQDAINDRDTAKATRDEDSEVARLARSQRGGFGLSSIVDKFVGFTLFNVDEDGDSDAAAPFSPASTKSFDEHLKDEEDIRTPAERKQAESKRRRDLLARTASSSADSTTTKITGSMPATPPAPAPEAGDKGTGWKDAAWLLSVASRVLY